MTTDSRTAAAELILRACGGRLCRSNRNYWDVLDQVSAMLAGGLCVRARLNRETNVLEINLVREKHQTKETA